MHVHTELNHVLGKNILTAQCYLMSHDKASSDFPLENNDEVHTVYFLYILVYFTRK